MDLPHDSTVFLQLAEGLGYIHSKNLIHQDIKPQNVLISVDSKGKITMKLADFGLSKSVNERGSNTTNSGLKGTNKWLACWFASAQNHELESSQSRLNKEKKTKTKQHRLNSYFHLRLIRASNQVNSILYYHIQI